MRIKTPVRSTLAAGALGVATLLASAASSQAAPIVGLSGVSTLIGFDSASPGTVTSTLSISGLNGEGLRGIDFRPSNGQLYALGEAGTLFTVNTTNGAATAVGPGVPVTGAGDVGFSFNPVPDAIRVVTASDQNLRVNPTAGTTTADTPLAFAAGDRNAGANPTVTGAAYTNQVPGTVASTTLYGIDATTSSLVLQNPPNNGTLTTIGSLGVSLLNSGQGSNIGFDIDGVSGAAFASLVTAIGTNALYSINFTSGAATLLGNFGSNTIRDIAVGSLNPVAVPEPASLALFGLSLAGLGFVRRKRSARKG